MTQAQIIDGKGIAARLRSALRQEVQALQREQGLTPGLAAVLVGENPASQIYVRMKVKACKEVGIYSRQVTLPAATSQEQLLALIAELNHDPQIHGILVQLPLPAGLDERAVLESVRPAKDADGFHPENLGYLLAGYPQVLPCTPAGILKLIDSTGIELVGAQAVVVGRSLIVGKPTALLLLSRHATVTLCHSRTRDLEQVCRRADVLVAATGRPRLITAEMVQPGAVVIDVGVNRMPDRSLVGDVDFEAVRQVAGYLTPVPGGVGPMTIAMLMQNTVAAARRSGAK
ncbi:MAG TPA: bifunctional methylenetetrahydrofolate dehydrogenase/methenyltetrahydrofolate cyclohydrolase FolD [Candidatus Fraserbacteria bacterium]|nr:bifunctional methylenetetrahydrofolate dehydrogenase/methenyltetrahydrofolate cyclohydrolase FolD [Candidatus Fraserbacteria bacterium]